MVPLPFHSLSPTPYRGPPPVSTSLGRSWALLLPGVCPYHSMDPGFSLSSVHTSWWVPSYCSSSLPQLASRHSQIRLLFSKDQVLVVGWLRPNQVSLPKVHSLHSHHMFFVWVTLLHQIKHTPHIFYNNIHSMNTPPSVKHTSAIELFQALQVPLDNVFGWTPNTLYRHMNYVIQKLKLKWHKGSQRTLSLFCGHLLVWVPLPVWVPTYSIHLNIIEPLWHFL